MPHLSLTELGRSTIDHRYKGIPLGTELRLSEIGAQGWNVARGDLSLPVTTLRQSALDNNLVAMAQYCARHGALLAPHGKTTMAPQLFERQLAAGAWGMTAATPSQAAVMRKFGVGRIILANQLVEPDAWRWVAEQREADDSFEFFSLVDDPGAIAGADQVLDTVTHRGKLPVLLEIGVDGGRAGARTTEQALAVARAVAASRHLVLAGVEIYEGLITGGISPEDMQAIDKVFGQIRDVVTQIAAEKLFGTEPITVTAGGSAYFDRVVAQLGNWEHLDIPVRLIVRSGCYLTHDLGKYHHMSPLDGRRDANEPLHLENALHGWARVLSRPEPGLAILGAGKRDLPYDVSLPVPLQAHPADGSRTVDLSAAHIHKMMDQHAHLTLPADTPLRPGDIVVLGMSHPCTAFDKTRLLPIIDDDDNVIDAVMTFF